MRVFARVALGAAALAALFGADPVRAQDGVTVRVMSFNVRTSYAAEDARSTCSNWGGVRKDNSVAQIRSVAPDFFGTQETSEEQKSFLDGQLAGMYQSIGRYSGSLNTRAGEVNAVYYKVADWQRISDGMIWLGPNPDAMSAAWGMEYYRTAVYGRFQHIKSGQTVCIFNTHYETPGKTEAQVQASSIILTRMASVCQATDKLTVMTGDLNAQPGDPAIAKLLAGGLSEPASEPTYCGNMISSACQTKFDYTLHRVKDGACYTKSEVLRTAFGGCYTSDHAPLLGTFCLGGSCCGETPTPTPTPTVAPSSTPTVSDQGSSAGSLAAGSLSTAANEANVLPGPGTVSAAKDSPTASNEESVLKVATPTGDAGGGDATGAAGTAATDAGSATQVTKSQSAASTGATGTVMAVLGVVGAVGAVAVVVVRKKRALDARLDSEKPYLAPVPSYFTRGRDSGNDDLSPLPRITEQRESSRATNSPIPTLCAGAKDARDSRSSSVSWKGGASPQGYEARTSSTDFSVRISSPVMLDDESTYSRSASYDSRMQESRINFSEAFRADSFDSEYDGSNGGALTKSARTNFAML